MSVGFQEVQDWPQLEQADFQSNPVRIFYDTAAQLSSWQVSDIPQVLCPQYVTFEYGTK